ncbi:MAG: Ig domain-containing protein [Mangrovibacterium sp.]
MKKVLVLLSGIVLLFSGCSKSDDEPEAEPPKLNISSSISTIQSSGGKVTIFIESSTGWKIEYDKTICDIETDTGFGNSDKTITINENTTYNSREISIFISTTSSVKISKKVTITQAGKEYVSIENISLSEKEITLKSNETHKSVVSFIPETASNKNLIWNSLDASVAVVNSDGTVQGVSSGRTKIIVKSEENNNIKDSIEVTVFNPVERIIVKGVYLDNPYEQIYSVSNELELCHEDRFRIKADIYPTNATNQNIIWTSSDTNLATIDNTGLFTITSNINLKGDIDITATSEDGGLTSTVKIKIDDVHLKAHGMSIIQSGSTYTVAFISRITTSMSKAVSIGSILLVNNDNSLIQIVTDITNYGYSVTAKSTPISFVYNGQNIFNFLSTLKFSYTYKVSGQSEYSTKEININASLWSSSF